MYHSGIKKLRLKIFSATLGPSITDYGEINILKKLVEEAEPIILTQDPLQACLAHFDIDNFDLDGYMEEVNDLLELHNSKTTPLWTVKYDKLPVPSSTPMVPSLEAPPILELKHLPVILKYLFLESNDTLPVIIASDLALDQENQLMGVLKEHKEAIGWSITDLKGIDPSICMHHIHCEKNIKPFRDMQRRLNLNTREVVKKEVVKWLDARIIYPILDNK